MQRAGFLAGVRAVLPLLVGGFPFGLIYGVLAVEAGLTAAEAQSMSWIVFAGSAQFLAAKLVQDAAPGLVIVVTIAVVNLRHMLYSASLAPYLRRLSTSWKLILSYLLTDEAYAITIQHYEEEGAMPTSHWFFLGAALAMWVEWQISTAIGIGLGQILPAEWPLDFTFPLTFIAIVVPLLKDWPMRAAAASAGLLALVTTGLPFNLGLILSALCGILLGYYLEVRK